MVVGEDCAAGLASIFCDAVCDDVFVCDEAGGHHPVEVSLRVVAVVCGGVGDAVCERGGGLEEKLVGD